MRKAEKKGVPDTDLVNLAKHGDDQAFGELVKRYHTRCVNLAYFILRDKGDAEDEAQNTYWKAFRHLDQFHGEVDFTAWLSTILVNQCLMLIREKRRARLLHLEAGIPEYGGASDVPSWQPDPEGELGSRQVYEFLSKEIRRIPPLLRKVVVLRDIEELPMTDVAHRLGISLSAAKSRLLRARMELRSRVLRHCGPSGHPLLISRPRTRLQPQKLTPAS